MQTIIWIKLSERNKEAIKLQEILTEHGCIINTRIGLHNGGENICKNEGLILLDVNGDPTELVNKLKLHWEIFTQEY